MIELTESQARQVAVLRADVAALRAIGERINPDSLRHVAHRIGLDTAELAAAVGVVL
jgi:2-hydroxychromene-2-carboxylate isomerase